MSDGKESALVFTGLLVIVFLLLGPWFVIRGVYIDNIIEVIAGGILIFGSAVIRYGR